jgi:protein ImuA
MTEALAAHLLSRHGHRPPPGVPFLGDLALATARVHEACGAARRTFALALAGRMEGPVIWIAPGWMAERINPDGMLRLADPARLLFVTPRRAEDLLWSMEEALRSGAVPLVVADLPEAPGLTPVRRLQLAAETGAAEGACRPLGLLLTPEGAAPGVETRWSLAPRHPHTREERWEMRRLRARTLPEAAWTVASGPDGRLTLGEPEPGPRDPHEDAHEKVPAPLPKPR